MRVLSDRRYDFRLPDIDALVDMLNSGITAREIAMHYEVGIDAVRAKFYRAGLRVSDFTQDAELNRTPKDGVMNFVTSTGYVCSLPKVSILENGA